ncbi:putative serine-type endopeptidase with a peptidoglycan binding-like domain protein [Beijerinckiaceae bacterium RH AL1]|nr:serine protease [Beijerinckiaceae bacterium]VVB46651.1 putative serine-type endopeptidase with a peptidoglycan binding-like domain protein [Beijerinckiaceae bacterium RH CH11]VVB46735.1 putative serine-type endopeptidase with a peptidoglycan binding-like domain protein [Beijerinckiaceae bacterium RH AL8]VVC55482.1 putative serine-type endopeptidase with a peptidoglycan binding-like domain protein [Beijerinckiaceae bacterium RH AL1]
MRRIALALLAALSWPLAAHAAPPGFYEAQAEFEGVFNVRLRQLVQLDLIAGGYSNAVPTEHFTTRTFKAVQQFQSDNGFAPTGRLDGPQIDRLVQVSNGPLGLWGFRKVVFPGRSATIWVPEGLGLDEKDNGTGLHYSDRQARLWLDFVAVGGKSLPGVHDGLLADQARKGWELHYQAMKDDWFVISTTSPNGHDHYYRYHQDGDAVVGFALEWDNAAGNVNAERIAVIDSAVLGASMKGEFFVDPPGSVAQASAPPPVEPQPAARETTPEPPRAKDTVTTGTAFFVSDDGYLVTNAHVVAECTRVMVKTDDGQVHEAARTATDTTNDLAILKLSLPPGQAPKRVAALRIGTRLGEGVEAFGFPHSDVLSSSGNFTLGNVSALTGLKDDTRYLQVSVPVQAGNSGGPLLDGSGNLVGVVSAKLDAVKMASASGDLPQNVNFAVKSAVVATFLDANRVTYKTGTPGGAAMQPADIADAARAMSGFVVCR